MSIEKFRKISEEWVFQHDNDPKHTSESTFMVQQSQSLNTTIMSTILLPQCCNESYRTTLEQSGLAPPKP